MNLRGNITRELTEQTNVTLEELNRQASIHHLPFLIVYVVIMVIGIIGNCLVLIIYKLKFKRSSARVYILSLALADLSTCIVGIPYHVLDLTQLLTYTMTYSCKVLSFLIGSCSLSSVFILLVVGLDRYLKVCRPLKKQLKDFGDRRACIFATFIAVIVALPNAILYGHSTAETGITNMKGVECFIDDTYTDHDAALAYLGFNVLVFILSVAYLVIIYSLICKTIIKHDSRDGAIVINKRTGLCQCKSADTDSIDSDYVEDDNDQAMEGSVENKIEISLTTRHEIESTDDCGNHVGCDVGEVDECVKETTATDSRENDKVENENGNKSSSDLMKPDDKKRSAGTTEGVSFITATSDVSIQKKQKPGDTKRRKSDKQGTQSKLKYVASSKMIRHVSIGSKSKEKTTRKITLMMLTITAVFIVSYLPFVVLSLLDTMIEDMWQGITHFESLSYDFLLRLYLINNVANPIIYSFWDKKFRKECMALFRWCWFCSKLLSPDNSTTNSHNQSSSSTANTTHIVLK